MWVDDEDFDITYHVRRSALPKPGTEIELDELVRPVDHRPLDRTRPLWEVYVIEGLTGGRVALVNKTHHAIMDRIGAVDVAAAILDINKRSRDLPEQPWIPNPAPNEIDLVVDAISDLTARPSEMVEVARLLAQDAGAVMGKVLGGVGHALEMRAHGEPGAAAHCSTTRTAASAGSPACGPTWPTSSTCGRPTAGPSTT